MVIRRFIFEKLSLSRLRIPLKNTLLPNIEITIKNRGNSIHNGKWIENKDKTSKGIIISRVAISQRNLAFLRSSFIISSFGHLCISMIGVSLTGFLSVSPYIQRNRMRVLLPLQANKPANPIRAIVRTG